jgi:hypothetical protein
MKTKLQYRSGVSLIESIIALGITVMLLIVLSNLVIQTRHIAALETNESQLGISSEAALSRINTIVRQAMSVETSYASYTSNSSTLIVKLPTIDPSGAILPLTYDYIIYRQNPADTTELQEIVVADIDSRRTSRTRSIAQYVTNFTVSYKNTAGTVLAATALADTKMVQVSLGTNQQSYENSAETTQIEQIVLRNK